MEEEEKKEGRRSSYLQSEDFTASLGFQFEFLVPYWVCSVVDGGGFRTLHLCEALELGNHHGIRLAHEVGFREAISFQYYIRLEIAQTLN